MRFVYMNNFRGFSNALVPLRRMNFLVGENSTGKSSFLSLLSLLNQPPFWFNPTFSLQKEEGFSSFGDIVSAWASDASCFQVGAVVVTEKNEKYSLKFSLVEFTEKDDLPSVSHHFRLADKNIVSIGFERNIPKYKTIPFKNNFDSTKEAISEFWRVVPELKADKENYKSFPIKMPKDMPLGWAMSILEEQGDASQQIRLDVQILMGMPVTWIAPIRSKPKRIYDGTRVEYSPEGEHAPQLLRRVLRSKTQSKAFADRLEEFGRASGLFETIRPHSFGRGSKDPFELLVQFKGAELNISNVGYGVSQVLPLIVEFLTGSKRRLFEVQQPEVHLHPRAQAALGGLIYELAKEQGHSFFIETHSDYLIDRCRLAMRSDKKALDSQALFFLRTERGNRVYELPISGDGQYPAERPKEFREFFIKEESRLLDL